MTRTLLIAALAVLVLAACQASEPPPPPPPPTFVLVNPPAPALGPNAPPGMPPGQAAIGNPSDYNGIFRGRAPNGQSVQVEIRDADATGARVNHMLTPSGPLLPGQAVWRGTTLTDEMPEGVFRYTPIGPDQLRYEGPGPSGGIVTVTLTRV